MPNPTVPTDIGTRREDILDVISKVAERETPLISMILGRTPAKAVYHQWNDKNLVAFVDALGVAIASTTTATIQVTSGTNTGLRRYIPGSTVLLIGSEYLLVSSTVTVVTNSTILAVTRGYNNSTAGASYAVGTRVDIVAAPQVAGFTAGNDHSQFGTLRGNYSQIFYREINLSGTAQAIDVAGNDNNMAEQMKDATEELMKEIHKNIFMGTRSDGTNTSNKTQFGGLRWFNDTYGTTGGIGVTGATKIDFANNFLTWDDLDKVLRTALLNGGKPGNLMGIVGPTQNIALSQLIDSRIEIPASDSSYSYSRHLKRYESPGTGATIDFMVSTDLLPDEVYIFPKDKVSLVPLKGRALFRKPLPENGDHTREMLLGEYTLEVKNADKLLFRLYNCAVA